MDMFQTPFLPEPSLLEDSEEQFEAFCRKSGVCSLFSQLLEFHPLFPIATSHLWKSLSQSETQGLYQSEQRESSHLRLGWKKIFFPRGCRKGDWSGNSAGAAGWSPGEGGEGGCVNNLYYWVKITGVIFSEPGGCLKTNIAVPATPAFAIFEDEEEKENGR